MPTYNYYLAPLPWLTTAPFTAGRYQMPTGGVGMVDLRPLPLQGTAGVVQGYAFMALATGSPVPTGGIAMGTGDLRTISVTNAMRNNWGNALGRTPAGSTLIAILRDHLINCDPVGEDTCPPIVPTSAGIVSLYLPGHSLVHQERFTWGPHPLTDRLRTLTRNQFREHFESHQSTGHYRKVLGAWCRKYRLAFDRWREFVPRDLWPHVEGPLQPSTSYSDNFTAANGPLIGGGTQLTWGAGNNVFSIISNAVGMTTQPVTWGNVRAEHDLSTDDHRALAENRDATSANYHAPACRMASGSTKSWYCSPVDATNLFIIKLVGGTQTNIVSVAATRAVGQILGIEANGSQIRAYIDRSTPTKLLITTDTAITGNLRGGVAQFTSIANATLDTWSIADVAYPVVGATGSGNSAANATQHAITLPAHAAGDRLIVGFTNDGDATVSVGASTGAWTLIDSAVVGTAARLTSYYRDVAGVGETLRLDTSASEGSAYVIYKLNAGTFDPATAPAKGTAATGSSASPNPPSLNPAGWADEDTLWIVLYGWDGNVAHSAYPAQYLESQATNRWPAANGCGIAIGSLTAAVGAQDPAVATIGSEDWIAQTLAVRPVQPVVIGDLAGSSDLTLTPTAAIQGISALAGTSDLTLSGSSTLTGAGALAGTAAVALAGSAPLIGSGQLVASSAITLTTAGVLLGSAPLAGSSALTLACSATIQGMSQLAGTSAVVFTESGTLTGDGALTGTAATILVGSATLAGIGELIGSAAVTLATAAEISSFSEIVGTSALSIAASGTLIGAGQLSGSSAIVLTGEAGTSATSGIVGTSPLGFSLTGGLLGAGELAGASALLLSTTATLSGSGLLAGSSGVVLTPSAQLLGSGALAGTAGITLVGSAGSTATSPIEGIATLAFSLAAELLGIGTLAGASTLAFVGTAAMVGEGILAGSCTIAFTTTATVAADGPLAGIAEIAFSCSAVGYVPGDFLYGTITVGLVLTGALEVVPALSARIKAEPMLDGDADVEPLLWARPAGGLSLVGALETN